MRSIFYVLAPVCVIAAAALGAAPAAAQSATDDVCCAAPYRGAVVMERQDCADLAGRARAVNECGSAGGPATEGEPAAADDPVGADQACCRHGDGRHEFVSNAACARAAGRVVSDRTCARNAPICCEHPSGRNELLSRRHCARILGRHVPDSVCEDAGS